MAKVNIPIKVVVCQYSLIFLSSCVLSLLCSTFEQPSFLNRELNFGFLNSVTWRKGQYVYCTQDASRRHPWYLKVRLWDVQEGQQSQVEHPEHGEHPAEGEEEAGSRVGLRAHRAGLVVERAPRSPGGQLNLWGLRAIGAIDSKVGTYRVVHLVRLLDLG